MSDNNKKSEGGKPFILIIEDDLFLVKAYGMKFKKEGWSTELITDGNKALEALSGEPPDVVLLDLMLPGPSGFEILEAMRKNDRWKNVPVFILTNLSQEDDRARADKLGVVEYIVKVNSRINDVVEKIKKVLPS
jgi:DNA-binding response OmpR family regulator